MKSLKIILGLIAVILSASLVFSDYPEIEVGDFDGEELSINGWSGTEVKVYVNDQEIDTYLLQNDPVDVELDGEIPNDIITASTGSPIRFLNTGGTYNLSIKDGSDTIWAENLTSGSTTTQIRYAGGDYILEDVNPSPSERTDITIEDELIEKNITLTSDIVEDGENSIRFEIEYFSDSQTQENTTQEETFIYDKYSNDIEITPTNITTNTRSVSFNVTGEDTSLPYYYIVNREGEFSNCFFSENEFSIDENPKEVTVGGLREGDNTIRVISTEEDSCTSFTGEDSIEVEVDTQEPSINLYEASIGTGTSSEVIDEGQFDSTAYLNEGNLKLVYDSDATTLNYTLNGRGDGPLVDDLIFEEIDWIQNAEIDSTGSRLSIDIYPESQLTDSYVKYGYGDRRTREKDVSGGVISLDFQIDEEFREVDLEFFKDDSSQGVEKTLEIYDLAYQEKGEVKSAEFDEEEELYTIDNLILERGRNNLTLFAYDDAGNLKKQNHVIKFDDETPELEMDSMKPKRLFESEKARSPVQSIDGKTNKEDVEVTIFTIPQDTTSLDLPDDKEDLSCESDSQLILRSLGQLDSETPGDSEVNLEEQQATLSLGSILNSRNKITTDSNGEFEDAYITFQEGNFDREDLDEDDRSRESVATNNEICFAMKDKYGNTNVEEITVEYDAGNTLWTEGQVTVNPATVYASEIEQTGEQRGPSSRVQFSVVATFTYQGEGSVTNVDGLRVNEDNIGQEDQGSLRIKNGELNHRYQDGELLVYFPVEIQPLNEEPLDYPSELDLNFAADFTYDVDSQEIPIDTRNPVYFETELNIEKPLDHTKWLSPSTINDGIEFLNESIETTEQIVDYLRTASVVGVVACTGTKLWAQYQIALEKQTDDPNQERINDIKEKLYYVCDRVACSSSPSGCQENEDGNENIKLDDGMSYSSDELAAKENAEFVSEGDDQRTLGRITSLNVNDRVTCTTSNGSKGVLASFDVETYEESSSWLGGWEKTDKSKELTVRQRCVDAQFEDEDGNTEDLSDLEEGDPLPGGVSPKEIGLKDYSNACYTEGAPNFDQTRCWAPGLGSGQGWDPSNNIIESARCGCITDSYSHAQNLLKVQEGIRKCLQEAKLGISSGSYCERLMSQAVCDVATNLLFSGTLGKFGDRTGADGEDPRDQGFFETLAQSNTEGNEIINERYDGTILSEQGMSTEQIVNNVCLGAASGDWSALEESVLTSIDQNQVEPILGPAFPESRLMGVNPFSGTLTAQYRFTHAIVSGGQNVRTDVNFICDSDQPGGDYCPPGRHSAEELNSEVSSSTLTVREDESVQDTIVLTDENARFRFNVLELTHEYEVDGDQKTEVQEQRIRHNTNGLIGQCYWNGGTFGSNSLSQGYGISCDSLFTDTDIIEDFRLTDSSKLVPSGSSGNPVFYPGNPIRLFAESDLRGKKAAQESNPRLYYKITCNQQEGGGETTYYDNTQLENSGDSVFGQQTYTLIDSLPDFAIPAPEGDYITESSVSTAIPENAEIRARYVGDDDSISSVSIENLMINGDLYGSFSSVSFSRNEVEDGASKSIALPSDETVENLKLFLNKDVSDKIEFEIVGTPSSSDVPDDGAREDSFEEEVIATFSTIQSTTNTDRSSDLNNLAAGTCNLQTRVLTSQMAEGLTKENFEDFSPENMNLTNIDSSPMNEFRFDITEERDSNRFRFEIVKPASSNSYCVDSDDKTLKDNIQLVMPITTSNDDRIFDKLNGDNLNISYSGDRYSLGDGFFDVEVSLNKDSRENPKSFVVDLKPSEEETLSESFTDDEVTIYVDFEQKENDYTLQDQDQITIRLDENACNSQQSGNSNDDDESDNGDEASDGERPDS